jgi:hypothetical protein
MPVGIQMFATISSKDHLQSLQQDLHVLHNAKSHQVIDETSVADPDPYVLGPPGSGSVSKRYGFGSFYHQAKIASKKNLDSYCFLTSL